MNAILEGRALFFYFIGTQIRSIKVYHKVIMEKKI